MAGNWEAFSETWTLIFQTCITLNNNYFDKIDSDVKYVIFVRISLQFISNVLNSQPLTCNEDGWMKIKHKIR